ncbi:tRNA pseudouridine(13) synthase TruD [Marinobacter salinexigens]|uniref:tRNA pseudouridine synthase D n=1 Tax=Marinobacter salinexigens TaxID=2919747 RepID=A0A5B0VIB2_9GAMM|nr:tRNA pseudouridine(13) synthase TruD [Marinobacter salinexigens]KAA1173721.1 tRNA pseudouridine(13) synthase TruD [Marinobacter salinexigens]
MTGSDSASGQWRLDWPTSSGHRLAEAKLKSCPEDFRVDEDLTLEGMPEDTRDLQSVRGEGEHLCILLEKTGDNSEYVARELASLAGCRSFDVGLCGLKDRHAVTSQWFSLYRPGMQDEDLSLIESIRERWSIRGACRFFRKLRRGDHQRNHFVITLRDVRGTKSDIDLALNRLRDHGAPNYFGPQRFGIGGANLDRAAAMNPSSMEQRRKGRKGRGRGKPGGGGDSKNVLYFSAARSWIFNEVLARRVEDQNWLVPLDGEPGLPDGQSGTTGPLWGDGGTRASGDQEGLERSIAQGAPELLKLFATTRMKPERRSLAVVPGDLSWHWSADGNLELKFYLLPGQYATTILNDIFELEDVSLSQHNKQQG